MRYPLFLLFSFFMLVGQSQLALADPQTNIEKIVQQVRHALAHADANYGSREVEGGVNVSVPELGKYVDDLSVLLETDPEIREAAAQDRAIEALRTQTLNHLQHVSFRFVRESDDYVHENVLPGPYPYRPSILALTKTLEFFEIFKAQNLIVPPAIPLDPALEKQLLNEQDQAANGIIANRLGSYKKFRRRLQRHGRNASFPEYGSLVKYLEYRLKSGEDVLGACRQNAHLEAYRVLTLKWLRAVRVSGGAAVNFPYYDTNRAIERATEFFDVLQRAVSETPMPPLYHTGRYEYYIHFLLGETPDFIRMPTLKLTGATDLLKVRGVPIGFVGINTTIERVDGFKQTSYEFGLHDDNHCRRMYQFLKEEAARRGMTIMEYSEFSDRFMNKVLVPLIVITKDDPKELRARKQSRKMLLFEVGHEDALPADPAVLSEAILRPPMKRTPFERIENGNTVVYFMEPGATTLAYAFRKLAHTFYDSPDDRKGYIAATESRTRLAMVDAALDLLQVAAPIKLSGEALRNLLEQYVATDEGFPDAFIHEVKVDIKDRVEGASPDFAFLISEPVGPEVVIEKIRARGKRTVSLFGYSALGYEDEAAMLRAVRAELQTYDPQTTEIIIGATPEGIGAAYEIAKSMGFETTGIVSTKSLANGGNYSRFADHIYVVRDETWGGYLPGTIEYSPTAQAFLGSSDVILAHGGGLITAMTIFEARKAGKEVHFSSAEMNHAIALQDAAARGLPTPENFNGPAQEVWDQMAGSGNCNDELTEAPAEATASIKDI